MASYIAFGLFEVRPFWFLDQIALFIVAEEQRRTDPDHGIANLPREYLH